MEDAYIIQIMFEGNKFISRLECVRGFISKNWTNIIQNKSIYQFKFFKRYESSNSL